MASSSSISLLLLLAVVLIAAAPSTNAILFNGQNIVGIEVSGHVSCTSTGNPTGPALVGATVSLTCNGSPTVLGQGTTDSSGNFSVVFTNLAGIPLVASAAIPRVATIRLPVLGCAALPTTGAIRAGVTLSSSVLQIGIGLVAGANIGAWAVVAL